MECDFYNMHNQYGDFKKMKDWKNTAEKLASSKFYMVQNIPFGTTAYIMMRFGGTIKYLQNFSVSKDTKVHRHNNRMVQLHADYMDKCISKHILK